MNLYRYRFHKKFKGVNILKKDIISNDLQDIVSDVLVRHRSILDVMTKLEESNSRINRAVAKSVTSCGCISINANKQELPTNGESTLSESKDHFKEHVEGELCGNCKEVVEKEIGNHVFYVGAICNTLGINLNEAVSNELQKVDTLGIFSLL